MEVVGWRGIPRAETWIFFKVKYFRLDSVISLGFLSVMRHFDKFLIGHKWAAPHKCKVIDCWVPNSPITTPYSIFAPHWDPQVFCLALGVTQLGYMREFKTKQNKNPPTPTQILQERSLHNSYSSSQPLTQESSRAEIQNLLVKRLIEWMNKSFPLSKCEPASCFWFIWRIYLFPNPPTRLCLTLH